MSKFKDFLKINEAGAGPVAPTLTAGANWEFPNSQTFFAPNSFQAIANRENHYEKPLLKALHTAQYLVQNIVSDPKRYGITNPKTQIIGTPQYGGTISGLDYNRMITAGASRGLKFLPTEFDTLKKLGIFSIVPSNGTMPQTTTIDVGKLYQTMKKEIAIDHIKDSAARTADTAKDALTTGLVQPGNGAMTLGRHQYNV